MKTLSRSLIILACTVASVPVTFAQSKGSTEYRLSFADAVHHVMLVEATYRDVPRGPFTVQMSRSSPGRYAAFEYAANVFEERFTDEAGKPLAVTRPDPRSWTVAEHGSTVKATYKLFGDRVDGTFMAVDSTHAHLNWTATLMWAHGFDDRPSRINFVLPANSDWQIATQLYPTTDAMTYTAPNLQYLMDSPAEVSHFRLRTFTVAPLMAGGKPQTIRVAAHANETDAEFETYYAGVQKIVREEQAVFGETPEYEPGSYTFLSDALPWDNGDGMEHRNSTVITGTRLNLGTVAHEYFHNWNVERIRPEGLEPFSFRDVNMSGLMFIAEGFTQYYGNLAMLRSGNTPTDSLRAFAGDIGAVLNTPAQYRSAMDMSRMAPFVDGSSDLFPTYYNNDYVSYYTFGDAVALGLDLTLRAKTDGKVTLDDFMRAMWRAYGKPGGAAPGLVGHPYSIADVQTQLAAVSGDAAFASDFVRRYMIGSERMDYASLLLRAGYVLRKQTGTTLGALRLVKNGDATANPRGARGGNRGGAGAEGADGLLVAASTVIGSPAYNAGLDLDDVLLSVGGSKLADAGDLPRLMAAHKPGDVVELVFLRRGVETRANATLAASSAIEIVPVESTGTTVTSAQQAFRSAWLDSKVRM